jgi:hypothetical protein
MKKLPHLLVAVVLGGFLFGLIHLFNLRFESGDNYPAYSSLRSDPLGSKAFYESVGQLLPARRHLRPLSRLGDGREATLFWLGQDTTEFRLEPNEVKSLEAFLQNGGRVVCALLPVLDRPRVNRFQALAAKRQARAGPATTNAPPAPSTPPGNEIEDRRIALKDRWGFALEYAGLAKDDGKKILPAAALRQQAPADSSLPARLNIHSGLYFDKLDSKWRVLYARVEGTNRHPVLIERSLGRGSIVLTVDPYCFSNESLRREREPELLAWFVGPAREVVFDETHLGVREEPGVATLARKYRLGGLFFALLVLAGLFIWRNSVSFMPPYEEQLARERGDQVEGKDSAGGFINLLKRNIAPVDLMKVCLEQWNAHFTHARKPSAAKLEAMQKIIDAENRLEPKQRNPVRMYREFCTILQRGPGVKRET